MNLMKFSLNYIHYSNSMNKEVISIEPEYIQFSHQSKQLIKVTNRTSDLLDNCFFCMFNTNKYQFTPESFRLEPSQQKLVTVTLKLRSHDSSKEFAYLKAKNINKRIVIHNNPPIEAEEILRSPQSGVEDLHTLSSRDYRQNQKVAYERVIADKEAYIKRLERKIEEQEDSVRKIRTYGTGQKNKNFYINEIQELEIKIDLINQEKEQLLRENLLLQEKLDEFQAHESKSQKEQLISRQIDEIQYLEGQCEEFLKKISEKQSKIQYLTSENQRRVEEEKVVIERSRMSFEEKLKGLEQSKIENQSFRQKIADYEKEIEKKGQQIEIIKIKLGEEEAKKKKYLEDEKKVMKLQLENNCLEQKNNDLSKKVKNLEVSVDELKEQTIIYKSKIIDQDASTDKVGHYMEVALESCKNENQLLKKSKLEMERSLSEVSRAKNLYQSKIEELKGDIRTLREQNNQIKEKQDQLQERNRMTKQESHDTIMKLKSQNIDLIEKINLGPRKDVLAELNQKISQMEEELDKSRIREVDFEKKLQAAEQSKEKLMKKLEKYKKEAKKQLKNIEDNVLDELKKTKMEKKKLTKKIEQFEQSAHSETFDQTRNKTKTHYDVDNPNTENIKNKYPRSQQGERKTGIKDQRKQLEESQANSRQQIDLQGLYCELGELRELKNYITKEFFKFGNNLGFNAFDQDGQNQNSIFQAINFFRELERKLNEGIPDERRINEAERQIEFLKGRLAEIDSLKKEAKVDQSSIELVGKPDHEKHLLEFVRQQMKSQYKKLYDALKLNEDKYEILRKKIYEEYRVRLIELMSKKDKDERTVAKVEATLERFIEGLSNLSHKEAVLAKEVKLKQAARKENGALKEKVNNLTQLLEAKKGYCNREAVKVFNCENENQWFDNIRLQAQLLTYEAENARLLEQVGLHQNKGREFEEEMKSCITDLELKEQEITRLKKQVIKIDREREVEAEKSREQIESLQKKYLENKRGESHERHPSAKDKEFMALKEDLQKKKELIKNLKEKQKMLEELLESTNRANSENRQKGRKDHMEEIRMQESLREFKDANRELRSENNRLKQNVESLEVELNKKNVALKRLKSEGDEQRIKIAKGSVDETEKLRNQVRDLKDQLRKAKEDCDKLKKRKDKDIQQIQSEMKRMKNEVLIEKRSLESIIRALIDTVRRIYSALDIIVRKRGFKTKESPNFDDLLDNPAEIDSLKVYESFEPILESLKQVSS